jgi:hypothetical protein
VRTPQESPEDLQRRFEYIQGVFLTQYGSFIATLLASFAWFILLWTQRTPQGFPANLALFAATLGLNALVAYFLTQVTFYSRVLLAFIPDEAHREIRELVDSKQLGLGMRLSVFVRQHSVIRAHVRPGEIASPPYLLYGLVIVGFLTVLETVRLFC